MSLWVIVQRFQIPGFFAVLILAVSIGGAQTPTGDISGTVTDPSGAAIGHARITITNKETGLRRIVESSAEGTYATGVLPPGRYFAKTEVTGFAPLELNAMVEIGSTTTLNFSMKVGIVTSEVNVSVAAPQMKYDSHGIDGVATRLQIEKLPLNGRDFTQLAFLEPGVTVTANRGGAINNALFNVSILGAAQGKTRVTVDGGDTRYLFTGGSSLGVSQEAVQEFQISTANLDLSTGLTSAGAINIVTRSGGNDLHGSAFYFFRDHNLAAYPALSRDPQNPDPYFARRQTGFYLGGPVRKDRLFFFVNWEHNNQDAVVAVQPRTPEFTKFGGVFPNPYDGNQISARLDFRVDNNNNAFMRFTHDGNGTFAPPLASSLPSNWRGIANWSDQSIAGLTSVLRPTLINDLRFAYSYFNNRANPPTSADCPGSCLGLGSPQIDVQGASFTIGNHLGSPAGSDTRRYHWIENLTWQRPHHRMLFGAEWEHYNASAFQAVSEPASLSVYSPQTARQYNISLPASMNTSNDILRLPLISFETGIGNPGPPFFGRDRARRDDNVRFHWQDSWRLRPRLTFNYGLAYSYQARGLNLDLPKPNYLAPIFGTQGLAPSQHIRNKWAPSVGFAWSLTRDNKTVIRAGAGTYHDALLWAERGRERIALSPRGNGRSSIPGSLVLNSIPDIQGVPVGRALDFTTPTAFTGADLLSILTSVRADLRQRLGDPFNTDLAVRNIEVFKSAPSTRALLSSDYTTPYSEHFNVGIQREIARDLVISADFVIRQSIHLDLGAADYNHFNSVRGSVIPNCLGIERDDPKALCSVGEITVQTTGGRSRYRGLLLRVDKRYSHRIQFLASYSLSSFVGSNGVGNGFNKDNWFENFGPLDADRRHLLTVSGIVDLPWGLQVGLISAIASKAPFSATVANVDFNGDGTDGDVLPGTKWNQINRTLGKDDLVRLVDTFNRDFGGTRTSRNQLIPRITLPGSFELGDNFSSQDIRLSKVLKFRERWRFTILGEVFNLFNVANLSGYGTNLVQISNFGQPSNRITQVFGSGGPRAFQFGARLSF